MAVPSTIVYGTWYCLGNIRDRNWYGPDGMEHLRTTKEPKQAIPTFAETVALLMKVRTYPPEFSSEMRSHHNRFSCSPRIGMSRSMST